MSFLSAAPETPRSPPPVQTWHFPEAREREPAVTPPVDPARFVEHLGIKLGAVAGMPVTARCDGVASRPSPAKAFVRGDGMWLALALPLDFIGALVGQRCGGGFVRTAAAGASGARVEAELTAEVLAAADAAWPGAGSWSSAAAEPANPGFAVDFAVGGLDFTLACAVTAAPKPIAAAQDHSGWTRSLQTALDATPFAVRAVLHDRTVSLGEALAFRVGDIVPIETQRDVSLRLGDRALARGTILPDGDGGHRVTIVAVGHAGVTHQSEELP